MKVLLIRHASAEKSDSRAGTQVREEDRPLTEVGTQEWQRCLAGMQTRVPYLTQIIASPFMRTRQTALLLHEIYRESRIRFSDELAPGVDWEDLYNYFRVAPANARIALVSHEPDLSLGLLQMLDGIPVDFERFERGAIASIQFQGVIGNASAQLEWFLQPSELHTLATGFNDERASAHSSPYTCAPSPTRSHKDNE